MMFSMRLGSLARMMLCVETVGMGQMRMMPCIFVGVVMVVARGFAVMVGGFFEMLGSLLMVLCGALGVHVTSPIISRGCARPA